MRKKRVCKHGHDTWETGRYPGGNCAECSRALSRRWHYDNPGRIWGRNLARYGMTVEDYDVRFKAQGGVCRVCGQPPGRTRLCVDHDHETGVVRGLLCQSCNRGLGLLGDNPTLMRALADYVEAAG